MLLSMAPYLHLFSAFYYWMEVILGFAYNEFWSSTLLCYIYWSKYYILSMHLLVLQECHVVYLIIQMNLNFYNAVETFGSVYNRNFWYLSLFLIFIGLLFRNKRLIAKQREQN